MKKLFLLSLIFTLVFSVEVLAGKRYWLSTTSSNWNTTANWAITNAGTPGASVPGASDTVYFTSTRTGQCNLDANASMLRLEMGAGCGTFVQSTFSVTIGTSGALLSGGTFTGGSGNITLTGVFDISGCAFTSTSGTFSTNSNFDLNSGSFAHNSGTAKFTATNIIDGTVVFYLLTFSPAAAATHTINNTITAQSILTLEGSSRITLDDGTINAESDITVTNSSTSGTGGGDATIIINGTAAQVLTGQGMAGTGRLPNITINKSSGTLSLMSVISVNGHWVYTQGTVSAGTSAVVFVGNFNVDGQGTSATMSFYKVQVGAGTRTLTGNLDCNENLATLSGTTLVGGSYTINVGGSWDTKGTWTYGTSTVVFDGIGYHRIQGATSATVGFANLTVNHRAPGSITLVNPVKVNVAMTLALGRVKSTSTNFLEFANDATCTVTNNDSAYVHGPVLKTGNQAFSFPLGDTTLHDSIAYHPLAITAPVSTGDQFTATYFASAQSQGSTTVDSLTGLSTAEYWTLDRSPGSPTVTVTVGWNRNSPPASIAGLRVAGWNSTASAWADLGQASVTVSWPTGTVTATATTIFNSNAAVITTAAAIPKYWGYATLKRKLDGGFYEAKGNALYFRFDDEYNDQNHNLTYKIYNTANTDVAPTLVATSNNAALTSYGDNRFRLDLWTSTTALAAGYYILEVRNEKNEVFYLRFKKN